MLILSQSYGQVISGRRWFGDCKLCEPHLGLHQQHLYPVDSVQLPPHCSSTAINIADPLRDKAVGK